MAQIPSQNCTYCSEIAALYCYNCKQCLCTQCQRSIHRIVAVCRDHKVGDIHKAGNRIYKPVPTCDVHSKEFFYYCDKCDCLTCKECITSSHNGHITKEIKNIADIRRKDVDQMINKLKTKVEEIEETLKTIDGSHSLQIQSDSNSYIENVEKTSQEIHQIIDRNKLINVTTATDFRENEKQDLKRKRVFFQRLSNEYGDRLLKFENLLQEPHDSIFFTEWKCLQTELQIMTEESEQQLSGPRRIDKFNQDTFIRAVIEDFDDQFQMGIKDKEIALAKLSSEVCELRAEVESKQSKIDELSKEREENTLMQKTILKLEKELEAVRKEKDKDVFGVFTGMISPALHGQQSQLSQKCNRANVLLNNDTFEVEGTFDQIISLNESLMRSKKQGGVLKQDSQGAVPKKRQPPPQSKQQDDDDGQNIIKIEISEIEYKMMKKFYPNTSVFTGFISYKDDILLKYKEKNESDKSIRLSLYENLNKLNFLTNLDIQAPNDINIDNNKLQEVKIAVASVSEDIFWHFSYSTRTLSLKGSHYEKLQAAKNKCEFILGIRQQGRGGRGRRKIDTDPDYQSDNRPKSPSNDMNASFGRSTRVTSSSSTSPQDMVYKTPEGLVIRVYVGNILKLNVDCIVNAANENLRNGGGVADVISRAAGYGFQKECDDYIQRHGQLMVTECCTTSAGSLPYRCVIHAVGPRWYNYTNKIQCAYDLEETVKICFQVAEKKMMKSVAIPAISSGIFGVPREVCCTQYCNAVKNYSASNGKTTCLREIHCIDNHSSLVALLKKEFQQNLNI